MKLENYTPHPINILGEDGAAEITLPSLGVARVGSTSVERDPLVLHTAGGKVSIPVISQEFGEVVGLPDAEPKTFLVVSGMVRAALPYRRDLLVPADLVRDGEGKIIGCKALAV